MLFDGDRCYHPIEMIRHLVNKYKGTVLGTIFSYIKENDMALYPKVVRPKDELKIVQYYATNKGAEEARAICKKKKGVWVRGVVGALAMELSGLECWGIPCKRFAYHEKDDCMHITTHDDNEILLTKFSTKKAKITSSRPFRPSYQCI